MAEWLTWVEWTAVVESGGKGEVNWTGLLAFLHTRLHFLALSLAWFLLLHSMKNTGEKEKAMCYVFYLN